MECYDNYIGQLESLSKQIAEMNSGMSVDLLSDTVTEPYFDKVDFATSMMLSFYEKHLKNRLVLNSIEGLLYTRKLEDYEGVRLCLLIDVFRCYVEQGHTTRLNSPEGVALLMVLVKFLVPDYTMTYQDLKSVPSEVVNLDGLIPYIEACSHDIGIPMGECVVSKVLNNISPKNERRYRIILYRFCSAVAEVDGVITEAEDDYIKTLLRLDDDDPDNDIVID